VFSKARDTVSPKVFSRPLPMSLSRVLIGIVVWVAVTGCGIQEADGPAHLADVEVPVRTVLVQPASGDTVMHFSGVAGPSERAALAFQVGGVLRERTVTIGTMVEADQLLARVFNPEFQPARDAAEGRVRELEVEISQARQDLARAQDLFVRDLLGEQEFERIRTRLLALEAAAESARAGLRQAERWWQELELRAPFTGMIEAMGAEPGEYVAAGRTVMHLATPRRLEVEVHVPARMLDGLQVGDRLSVTVPRERIEGSGTVAAIGASGSADRVLFPLRLELDADVVRPGDGVEVGIHSQSSGGLSVPLAAVMRAGDQIAVFRMEGRQVRRVPVRVWRIEGESAIVASEALAAGDRIVYAGMMRLVDGMFVESLP
jgi:RND family efflux transporter MFP subunit